MMTHGCLRPVERLRQIARASLTVGRSGDEADQAEPGRIGERLQQVGELGRVIFCQRCRQERRATGSKWDFHRNILTDVDMFGNVSTEIESMNIDLMSLDHGPSTPRNGTRCGSGRNRQCGCS